MSGITAGTALTIGAVVSAAGAVVSGLQAQQQGKFQAAVLQQQADRERLQAEADSEEYRNRQERLMASRRAILGGSGVDISSGSPLFASEDFAGETELQALKIRVGGAVRASRLEAEGSLARAKGNAAMTQGFFRAGSSLFTNGAKAGWFGN